MRIFFVLQEGTDLHSVCPKNGFKVDGRELPCRRKLLGAVIREGLLPTGLPRLVYIQDMRVLSLLREISALLRDHMVYSFDLSNNKTVSGEFSFHFL